MSELPEDTSAAEELESIADDVNQLLEANPKETFDVINAVVDAAEESKADDLAIEEALAENRRRLSGQRWGNE